MEAWFKPWYNPVTTVGIFFPWQIAETHFKDKQNRRFTGSWEEVNSGAQTLTSRFSLPLHLSAVFLFAHWLYFLQMVFPPGVFAIPLNTGGDG